MKVDCRHCHNSAEVVVEYNNPRNHYSFEPLCDMCSQEKRKRHDYSVRELENTRDIFQK